MAGTDAGQRTFRVDRMTSVEPTGEPVERPDGFDLAETWRMVTDEVEQRRTPVRASARCQPDAVWLCRTVLGTRIHIGAAEDDGRVRIEIRGHSVHSLAGEIAGLGARLEVIDPPELRDELARIGAELLAAYPPTHPDLMKFRRSQGAETSRDGELSGEEATIARAASSGCSYGSMWPAPPTVSTYGRRRHEQLLEPLGVRPVGRAGRARPTAAASGW